MAIPNHKIMYCRGLIGFGVQGTIAKTITYRLRHGNGHYGAILNQLYQDKFSRVVPISIKNTNGEPYRAMLKAGVAHWKYVLTADEKAEYNQLAMHIQHMSGYNLFLRRALKGEIEMFVDRGDPTAWDFAPANFITDEAWHDLDLSSIVPAGAKAVLLWIMVKDNAQNSWIMFRKNGNINDFVRSQMNTMVINIQEQQDIIVACDINRVIQYRSKNVSWVYCHMMVKGWWT